MPGIDWIPGVSQLKAGLQLLTGDVEGAARTTENFLRECPIVSQGTSLVQVLAGDPEGALETQRQCLGTINNVANGIPVVGHAKGIIHHAVGDSEGGNQALNAASRTTVVLTSGAVAGIASGGLGAIPAGIAAGSVYDFGHSAISNSPKGIVATIDNAIKNPSAGSIFDASAALVGDGLAGYSGGQMGAKIGNQIKLNRLEAARNVKMEQVNSALFDGVDLKDGQVNALGEQINSLTGQIHTIRHGTPQYWFDPKSQQIVTTRPPGVVIPVTGYPEKGKEAEVFAQVHQ